MIRTCIAVCMSCLFSVSAIAQQRPVAPAVPAPSDVAKPPADAIKTASGLMSKVLQPGTGTVKPGPTDVAIVHYTGWTTDGKMFDSSLAGEPPMFPVNRVIKGWGEGVQLMVAGEKRRLWIPTELAYKGQAGRPQGMLVFDIELIDVWPTPTTAPPDVSSPPADVKRTASGLAYKVMRPGKGGTRPSAGNSVTVHYVGWTTDGKMFDSSIDKQPISFGLRDVIEGWSEGVQLMTIGERTRFWIPERLAYKGERPPRGMLVFDVALIAVR